MPGRYFEEFSVGETFTSAGRTLTESDVMLFAGLSGDYNPLHTDEEFARQTLFGRRIAHGLLVFAISTGLIARTGVLEGTVIAFLAIEQWNFKAPVFIGDTITCAQTVASKRETKKPDRGIIRFRSEVRNQKGELVQEGVRVLMIRRRPARSNLALPSD